MDKIKVINGSKGKSYNLIAYFKLTDLDEKFIIFNDEKNVVDVHFAKIKTLKNEVRIVKPTLHEMGLIDRLIENSRSVRHRRVPSRDIYYLVYNGEVERTLDRKEYNSLLQSSLVKKQERNGKLVQIAKEKEDLKKEIEKIKQKKKEDATWKKVDEESRSITDDELLNNIEKEIKELELDEFHERCRVNLVRVLVFNLVSIVLVAILLYGGMLINTAATLFRMDEVFTDVYFINILKMYGITSLILLVAQIISLGTYKNFFGKLLMLCATIFLIFNFVSMLSGYTYSLGAVGLFIVAIVNIIINFSVYLQIQLKLM